LNRVVHRALTIAASMSTIVRRRWNAGLAKLLVAALLLQCMPFLHGGLSTAYADGSSVTEQTYGNTNTYKAATSMAPFTATQVSNSNITDYTWERVSLNLPPDARNSAAMAYDETARNVVMFGGQGNSGLFNETWIWDGVRKTWRELQDLSSAPSHRKAAAMAYDPVSKNVLLFGGEGSSGVLGDTWLWNGLDAKWEEVGGLSDAPSARGGAQIAYDGEQLVLFGGYTGSGSSKTPLGDTWLWNGTAWTEVQPAQSPPAAHSGQMAYDGRTAVLYGGNSGSITETYQSTGSAGTKVFTHDAGSPLLWKWDRSTQSWTSGNGPESFGRWGHAMAYDGRRAVMFGGETDYVWLYTLELRKNIKLPYSEFSLGAHEYGWTGASWERVANKASASTVYKDKNSDLTGKYYPEVQGIPNELPFPLTYASMAFDGKNIVMFGGHRGPINVMDKVHGSTIDAERWPAGNMNETWVFGYTPPTAPGVKIAAEPIINFDPQHVNDTVSVITDVYDDGTRTITSSGVEYRPYHESGDGAWIKVPNTGTQGIGSFTVTIPGLTWHQEYEVRGYAVNEIGISYTNVKRFIMKDDPNMKEPDVDYDRVGASVLHVKDQKRIVAVGAGVTNLLRKPLDYIHYYLQHANGTKVALKYNILNERQLELTWDGELQPGKYDVHLEHDFYKDYIFPEGLMVTALDFYKPRNFARVEVPSTSANNESNSLTLQGPFTEDPEAPKVYVLNDTNEVVTINESVLFKGSRLVVDKSDPSGKATISGEGRLYVNAGGAQGANLSYTLHEGSFTLSSDSFSIALNQEAVDYLNMSMPVKASSLRFVPGGLKLTGDLAIGLQMGNQRVSESIAIEDLIFRNNRFDLSGTFTMNNSMKVGPFNSNKTEFVVESRIPYVGVSGTGSLPDTDLSFDLYMKTKQGRLDSVSFGMYRKAKLASTGLQVNYLFGSVDKLAEKTSIPQKFSVTGSVQDVIVPELKHPQANYKFNLIGTDSIDMEVSSYGFNASGIEYYYWLPVKNMSMQTVVNSKAAGIKGFTSPGFSSKGDINVFEVIKGAIGTYSFNKNSFNGVIKGTVHVPAGIPRIGGATVRDVVLSVKDNGIFGTFRHNGVGANVKYTFHNNTILFEVEAEPPKKQWWEKGLDFMNSVSDFMDAAEPWLDLAEELLLMSPEKRQQVNVLSAEALKRVYDLKPISLSVQPEDTVRTGVQSRIIDGQLTAVEQTPLMNTELDASTGQLIVGFEVLREYEAIIALAGDHRSAALSTTPATSKTGVQQTVKPKTFYHSASNTTFLKVQLTPGSWNLRTGNISHIRMNELLFVNEALTLEDMAAVWSNAIDRPVTALTLAERGSYLLKIGEAQGEAILYKPDGRPYNLLSPNGNTYRDSAGNSYVLLDAVEAGTWMVSAGTSPAASLSRVPVQSTIDDAAGWVDAQAYPTVFDLKRTSNGQAIVEIYGADAHTKLVAPDGGLYALQLDPNQEGMNAIFEESQQKLTILLNGTDLSGQWKVIGSSFTSVVAYESTRKFKSIKPLLMEGRYTKYFDITEKGSYMLTVSGGDEHTKIFSPDGSAYTLNFEAPNGNAYLQPKEARMPKSSTGGDPIENAQIHTPSPAQDGLDTLYITLPDAAKGEWKMESLKKVNLQVQKLKPTPSMEARAASVSGAENRVELTWLMAHADPGSKVTIMLTNSPDQYLGEVIAEELPASGHIQMDIPAGMMPGIYHVSVASTGVSDIPVYAIAEGTVEVTAPYTLVAPQQPEVLSTGNGEASLRFPSIEGQVTVYRIWAGKAGETLTPIMDFAPEAGEAQSPVVSGLAAGASYTVAVSAIGHEQEKLVLSPLSENVTVELPVPQPASLTVTLDAGARPVRERAYMAGDGNEETLLITSAEKASLKVAADQSAALTLSINGQQVSSGQVSAGGEFSFELQNLLNVTALKEREYSLLLEAVNERGDRSMIYRKLFVDRTGPLLIISGGDDALGNPKPLNGTITADSKIYMEGQTDAGAKLDINGTIVPLDDEGRFVYYAPLDWTNQSDRNLIRITASDESGNKTESGFEVIRDTFDTAPAYPSNLAALTVGGAKLNAPYDFNTSMYQAQAHSDKVRVYALPWSASAQVKIDGKELTNGYVEVQVPSTGRSVPIQVQPEQGAAKLYSLQLDATGFSEAVLRTLKLNNATAMQAGDELPAQPFTGAEESYPVYVDHSVEAVTLTAVALKAGSKLQVHNQAVSGGHASQVISLQVGENWIPVTVTSPDNSTTRVYQVQVWRAPSNNARLQQLGLAVNGAELSTAFNPAALNYQVTVPYETQSISIQPVAEQSDATILIDGQSAVNGSKQSVPFTKNAQAYEIQVKAQDGTSIVNYTVSVLRQQPAPKQPPLLSSLTVDTMLKETFNPHKLKYGTKTVTTNGIAVIKAIADDPKATVTVQGKSLEGGGSFTPLLDIGTNIIIIHVEAADLMSSQTYSIDVERIEESGETNLRQTPISGGAGGWVDQTPIVRTTSTEGKKLDLVQLDVFKAKSIVEKSANKKDSVARIHVNDLPKDPADERVVSLNAESVSILAAGGMSLQIALPDAQVTLPAASLQGISKSGLEAYFRVVPIRAVEERNEVGSRIQSAELIKNAAAGGQVTVIGEPLKIETNYSGFTTELLFPLDHLNLPENKAAAQQILSELAVYIEHSDGDKVLTQGEIRYDEEGKLLGIAIQIEKFSTFTLVQMSGTTGLEPYMSGYPDGTFRPAQAITRAELAAILYRVGVKGTEDEAFVKQASGYPDVAKEHWAMEAILRLQQSGLMEGDNNGMFRPDDAVTRAEMASIAARLLQASPASSSAVSRYSDIQGHWAAEAIELASLADILQGYPDATFLPDNKLNRAEAVKVLNRLFKRPTAGVPSSSWPDVSNEHWALQDIESASGTVKQLSDGSVYVMPNH
jgi:hypothetical protein